MDVTPERKLLVAACVAVMVAVPALIIVIRRPEIDATEVLSLAKLKEPVLLEDGSTILKGEAPYVLEVSAKFVIVGSAFVTSN